MDLDLRGQDGVEGGFYPTIVSMALQGGEGIHDDGHCLGKSTEMGRFGEHERQRWATVLTGQLDLEFPVQGQLGHRVRHDASVFAHLVPGQTLESDACL